MADKKPTIITREQADGQRLVSYHMALSRAREALLQYGAHEPSCAARLFIAKPCNCGWAALRDEVYKIVHASPSEVLHP